MLRWPATHRIKIGFAVAQVSLHHPIRLAEQISLLDNITKGRIIAGLGRGTAYNIYDYQGYDVAPEQAQSASRSEAIMLFKHGENAQKLVKGGGDGAIA
jgi:alkanesulfonate monooxygenase SsuD/methylene tetrahydromethanopterin reductase-like flavin-dependent oxidoreductase (luciferase family)